ncbi:hypothetical protein PgNI_10148 [Pyricularia grisea]|uniref:SnoaL-like domain-containing protein n=1 Tax=Pyricularia grisea TaxID=148305 RepID=A0A6P8AZ02_PYRGI|nr:hypothetical protein PgNI_10148 [Pyricularia grisea]TLD07572.1 hypothetical protein PgNI_10148 [Pyricularia grisea]
MKINNVIASLSLLGAATAVEMTRYAAASGVEPAFESYLKELYASAEDPAATTTFTDMFTPDGQLIVLANTATGADAIIKLKQALLPPAGNKHWNHMPNVTTVDSQTTSRKTYKVLGVIETRFDGGNCSQAYYSTRFTVTKDASGAAQLKTHAGNLVTYDDFIVQPSQSPTNIPCGTD